MNAMYTPLMQEAAKLGLSLAQMRANLEVNVDRRLADLKDGILRSNDAWFEHSLAEIESFAREAHAEFKAILDAQMYAADVQDALDIIGAVAP